jgi:DNA polymerase-1
VSALFGFARTLITLLDEGAPAAGPGGRPLETPRRPLRLAAAFDSRGPTFRHKKYPGYKANRQKAPEDLHEQVPLVEEFLAALGVPSLRADGFEADDIIATLAGRCRDQGRQCYILSSDKDLLQLVGKDTYELRPSKAARGAAGGGLLYELVGPGEVKAEWGVAPEKMLDMLSLTGDSSDNVPGVRGIGEKTAVKLMVRHGSLDAIYQNIAVIEGSLGKKLAEGRESAYFSRDLIALEYGVPLPVKDIDDLLVETLDRQGGAKVLLREEVRQCAWLLDPSLKKGGAAGETAGTASRGAGGTDGGARGMDGGARGMDGGAERSGETAGSGTGDEPGETPAPPALRGDGTYKTILDLPELEALLGAAKKQRLLALDFETDSLDAWNARPIGISLALRPKEAFYVPVAAHRCLRDGPSPEADGETAEGGAADSPAPFIDPGRVRALLTPLLLDPDMTIAAHNAKYDYKVSRGWGVERWRCKIWDTMVAAWVANPDRNNYSLDSLAAHYFGYAAAAYNDIVPKGASFDAVSLETACRYSAEDADLCLRMKAHLEKVLTEAASLELFTGLEMPLLPILGEMEGLGIRIAPRALKEYGAELFVELDRIQKETWKTVGREFNLGSPKQLQEVLFTERKLRPGRRTKTGYSTDVDVLQELAREDPVPALILRHRTLAKLKSTYVDALTGIADSEGRIHTSFIQTGTATGRLSSREPNLQNIPIREEEGRRIREAFIARPGCLLISADYSQIELVILAHLSGDETLIAAFREGKDIHARTASLIFGIDEGSVRSDQRRIAKTINFGVMYGMSAFRLANELEISRTEAAAFISAYFKTYAGVSRFINGIIARTGETGYASTIFGRRRYIRGINSRNKTERAGAERVAVNTPIQGSAADIVKTAMLNLDKALRTQDCPARLLLQVHDELILECPRAQAKAAAALVRQEMEQAVTLKIPLRVSVEIGKRWGDFH